MSAIRAHFDRCRREDDIRAATLGVGLYGVLMTALVICTAASRLWS